MFLKSNDNTKCFEKEEDKNKPAYISENLAKLDFFYLDKYLPNDKLSLLLEKLLI